MIVITDPSEALRRSAAERIDSPDQTVEVATLDDAIHVVSRGRDSVNVVVMGPSLDIEAALKFAERAERQGGGVATLLVAHDLDARLLREALRAGVDDVLTLDAPVEEWREAVGRAQARAVGSGPSQEPPGGAGGQEGRIVSVFSTKGGCGKSLVASNLAVLAADHGKQRVGLVDLDLQSGDLAIMFQLMPALSIYDAAGSADRLDVEAIQGYLTPHQSGISLLAAPMEPSLADAVTPAAVGRILALMRENFPLTIIDGPALFTEQMLVALDASDLIVLVGSMDVPSIKNLRLAMNTLQQLGHPRDHIKLVLNRADSKVGLRANEVEKSLDAAIDVSIPSSRDVPLSINQGTPLAVSRARSPIVSNIAKLLPDVLPADANDEAVRGGRFRRR